MAINMGIDLLKNIRTIHAENKMKIYVLSSISITGMVLQEYNI